MREYTVSDRGWAVVLGILILAMWAASAVIFSGCASLESAKLESAAVRGYVILDAHGQTYRVDLGTGVVIGDGAEGVRLVAASVTIDGVLALDGTPHKLGASVEHLGGPHLIALWLDGLRWETSIGASEDGATIEEKASEEKNDSDVKKMLDPDPLLE